MYGPGDEATWGPCTGHPNDPRTEDAPDDYMTLDEALDAATEEMMSSPYAVAFWLGEQIQDVSIVDVDAVTDHLPDASVNELLTMIMAGDSEQIVAAAYELRERFKGGSKGDIADRAHELMKEASD